jgi:hypothetical protein
VLNRPPTFEVSVPTPAMSSLIAAVHDVVLRPSCRSPSKWQHDNVIGIDTPRIADLAISEVRRRHPVVGRPIVAIAVVAQRRVTVEVVFGLHEGLASALFTGVHDTIGVSADRASSLAEFLASTTTAALAAEGVEARFRHLENLTAAD